MIHPKFLKDKTIHKMLEITDVITIYCYGEGAFYTSYDNFMVFEAKTDCRVRVRDIGEDIDWKLFIPSYSPVKVKVNDLIFAQFRLSYNESVEDAGALLLTSNLELSLDIEVVGGDTHSGGCEIPCYFGESDDTINNRNNLPGYCRFGSYNGLPFYMPRTTKVASYNYKLYIKQCANSKLTSAPAPSDRYDIKYHTFNPNHDISGSVNLDAVTKQNKVFIYPPNGYKYGVGGIFGGDCEYVAIGVSAPNIDVPFANPILVVNDNVLAYLDGKRVSFRKQTTDCLKNGKDYVLIHWYNKWRQPCSWWFEVTGKRTTTSEAVEVSYDTSLQGWRNEDLRIRTTYEFFEPDTDSMTFAYLSQILSSPLVWLCTDDLGLGWTPIRITPDSAALTAPRKGERTDFTFNITI